MRLNNPVRIEIGTYEEFITEMKNDRWRFFDYKTPQTITNKDTKFVSTNPIMAGGYGPFLELKCIPYHILTINGANQRPVLRHHLAIRCRDDTNFELPGATWISIMKLDSMGKPLFNMWVCYNEISQTKGSRFKQRGERYYLHQEGIILYGGEKLAFYVYDSDIDIIKTDVLLNCDIFIQDSGGRAAE